MGKLLDGAWQGALFTGGWSKAAAADKVVEPATGGTLAEVGRATPADIEAAVERAVKAQKGWAATNPVRRAEILLKAAEVLEARRAEFTEWLVREIGSTRAKAAFEVAFAKDELVNAAALPFEARGVILPDADGRTSYATREPYGVCGVVTPFNVPLLLAARAVAPALAVGNAAFFFAGPSCMSPGRHIVQAEVFDRYVERMTAMADALTLGDPWTQDVAVGPMIRVREAERVKGWVTEALAAGATVNAGHVQDGPYHRPTVVTGVKPGMKLYDDETFGPVAAVVRVESDEEAVRVANDTPYGLAAAVMTADVNRGRRLTEQLHSGNVHVNDPTVMDYAYVPWGGYGDSGNGGRYGRHTNWEEYTQWKWTTVRETAKVHPFAEGK